MKARSDEVNFRLEQAREARQTTDPAIGEKWLASRRRLRKRGTCDVPYASSAAVKET